MEKQAYKSLANSLIEKMNSHRVIKGILVSYIITIPIFLILAYALTFSDFPEKYISTCVLITTIVSILVAGTASTRNVKSRGWLNGASVGLIYVLVLYIFSSLIFRDFSITTRVITMSLIGILTGAVGGIIGINMQSASKAKRKVVNK